MNDLKIWDHGLRSIEKILVSLPPEIRQGLTELLAGYRKEKRALFAIIQSFDSDATCRDCAGECCLNGKYRINVFDLLSHCIAGMSVSPNFEHKPLCPYGTDSGCAMEPEFRPVDCIMFICDMLDSRMSDTARSALRFREKTLQDCLDKATLLLDVPVSAPLLLWAERPEL